LGDRYFHQRQSGLPASIQFLWKLLILNIIFPAPFFLSFITGDASASNNNPSFFRQAEKEDYLSETPVTLAASRGHKSARAALVQMNEIETKSSCYVYAHTRVIFLFGSQPILSQESMAISFYFRLEHKSCCQILMLHVFHSRTV